MKNEAAECSERQDRADQVTGLQSRDRRGFCGEGNPELRDRVYIGSAVGEDIIDGVR